MYQILKQGEDIKIVNCDLWRDLPPEQCEECQEQEMKIVSIKFTNHPISIEEIQRIVAKHFPNWILSSWWVEKPIEVLPEQEF